MPLDLFRVIWAKLMIHPGITKVLLNSTGDLFVHPRHREILAYIELHLYKHVTMITNAAGMDGVPAITETIISFNGCDKDGYERTTGLDFDAVTRTIRAHYPAMAGKHVELHSLIWEGNDRPNYEAQLLTLWHDFPGRIRVSRKYDNQFREDHGVARRTDRIPCDYLDMLIVGPDGTVTMCSHDFHFENRWGNLATDDVEDVLWASERSTKRREHRAGEYHGLCERCNYNTPIGDRVRYLR